MNTWIAHPTSLYGETVDLLPLESTHFTELVQLAGNKRIWEFIPVDGHNPTVLLETLQNALKEREKGTQYTFVVYHKTDHKIIGSTRLMDIHAEHKKLEIGWTWLSPDYWATEVNIECKLLLLQFCFEKLMAYRVQLKTDELNLRSRRAIEKIGGKFEGILRNEMIRHNHTRRNSAFFSIIDTEWDDLKIKLLGNYQTKVKNKHTEANNKTR